jgi:hypothetical protein
VLILCKSQCLQALFFSKCCTIIYNTQDRPLDLSAIR